MEGDGIQDLLESRSNVALTTLPGMNRAEKRMCAQIWNGVCVSSLMRLVSNWKHVLNGI